MAVFVNALNSKLLIDLPGVEPGGGGGGSSKARILAVNPLYYDSTSKLYYSLLDDVNTTLYGGNIYGATKLSLRLASADATATGNIVLTIAGTDYTVAVGVLATWTEITLAMALTAALEITVKTPLTSGSDVVSVLCSGVKVTEG